MSAPQTADRGQDATREAYRRPAEVVVADVSGNAREGLSRNEARARLERDGPNALVEGHRRGPGPILLAQFTDFMIVVLLMAAVVAGLLGDLADTLVIVTIVVLNAAIGFTQEYRAERAIAALKSLAAPRARIIRDGLQAEIPASKLVVGDLVVLEAGDAVPADLRLLEAARLGVDESALTGESEAVEKQVEPLEEQASAIGDRSNMAHKGTLVTRGHARGVVVATGMQTELGRVARLLHGAERVQTPLQQRLARFGRVLSLIVLALCAALFLLGLLRGEEPLLMALTAVSLAVAAIPEALPAVVSVALALGARTLIRKQALVRKLPAVETLGAVTFICSDKTGTLTQNRMRVERLSADGRGVRDAGELPAAEREGPAWLPLLRALALNNDARPDATGAITGEPTEVALYEAARLANLDPAELVQELPRTAEVPFDSDRKRMSTLHRDGDRFVAFVKGAPEQVLPRCEVRNADGAPAPLDRDAALQTADRMAAEGLRVMAFAMRAVPEALALGTDPAAEDVETGLTFLGLVGMLDPPRERAAEAVAECRTAGITPVMITGDHPSTARAIAQRMELDGGEVLAITGEELGALSEEELRERVTRVRVYARTSPEQKIDIVQALQARGEFVAMTGDGVNDAPALKRANIGVAMGRGGTDVAKEAADMVLLDDDFASIVSAVREGRRIFDNIRKFIRYTMTSNSGELWTLVLAPLLGLPIPLLPVHILWINLVTDGFPGLALATEVEERGVMQRPPRPPRESIFAHGMSHHILVIGLLMGVSCLASQVIAMQQGWHWQTIVFTVLTLAQLGHALAVRSERDSLFQQGIGSNRFLLAAVVLTVGLQLAIIYVPALRPLFKTEWLSLQELAFCFAMAAPTFVAVEVEKLLVRRGVLYRNGV